MGCFSSPSMPPPPDYAGAAKATAAGDLAAARQQTTANRPDVYTPLGSQTWEQGTYDRFDNVAYDQAMANYDPASGQPPPDRADYTATMPTDQWTATQTLSPEAQKAFDANQRMQTGLANLGEKGVEQAREIFADPFSIEGQTPQYQGATGEMPGYQGPGGRLGPYGEHRQNVVDSMMSRVNTDIAREKDSKRSQLIAQGIPEGSEAYKRAMESSDRKQVDAQQQAEIAAEQMAGLGYASDIAGRQQMGREGMMDFTTGMDVRNQFNQEGMQDYTTGMDTRRQNIQEALLERQTPINEMSAFRTGSQVQQPQFQPYGQQTFTGGPDYSGAATQQGAYDMAGYNADMAKQNAMMGGLFSLGAAGIGAYPFGGG